MTVSSYTTDQAAHNNTLYIRRIYVPILNYLCIYFVSFVILQGQKNTPELTIDRRGKWIGNVVHNHFA